MSEERLHALEGALTELRTRLSAVETHAVEMDHRIDVLEEPNPIVVKARGWLGWLWENRPEWRTLLPYLIIAALLLRGGQGCDIRCDRLPIPDWVNPIPVPKGDLRVVVIYESADEHKLPAGQRNIIMGQKFRDWVTAHCGKSDGRTADFRAYDKDTDTANDYPWAQEAMKRPRAELPWIVVIKGTSIVHEGKLPADPDQAISLLSKYGA